MYPLNLKQPEKKKKIVLGIHFSQETYHYNFYICQYVKLEENVKTGFLARQIGARQVRCGHGFHIGPREHAFPQTEFVCWLARVTFDGSHGTMSTARPELPYPCNS